jgi:hypothetical protein
VNSGRDQRVYAYSLDGRLLWATSLPFPRASLAALTDDLVLFTSPMWPGQTAALDQRTGAARWTVDGLIVSEFGDTVVVGRGSSMSDGFDEEVVAVDAATGRELWRSETGVTRADAGLVVYGAEYRFTGRIRLDADSGELLDFRTGRWRSLRGVPASPAGRGPVNTAMPDGGVAILRYQGAMSVGDLTVIYPYPPDPGGPVPTGPDDGARVAAYGPDSPDPLWTADARGGTSVIACGPWLCLTEAGTTRVLDPTTGAERGRVGWPPVASGSAERFLGYDYVGMVATAEIAVFDARSGRRLASYAGWALVSTRYAEWVPMLRRGSGLSWHLATLSLDTGIAYPLATIDAAGERACQSTATHVGCTIRSGEVMLWHHNPARA